MQQWDNQRDYHSFANTDAVRVQHLSLQLAIDFDAQTVSGVASLGYSRLSPDAMELILDTRELAITAVTSAAGEPLSWTIGPGSALLGAPLVVTLPPACAERLETAELEFIKIQYQSSPGAEGLQWLAGSQTQTGKPFLFSQSQPVNARSWVPLQDSPKARISFDAAVSANRDCRVVMSAINEAQKPQDGIFRFRMDKPMPSHLLAIAAGELERIAIGPRSAVFAEPAMAGVAAKEFDDVEAMIQMAEGILGPYVWERFDILVLPPSFPFGGMENPCLTFLTPTLIAGDKSLVSTLAHELAHSWTGNLVSNATWRDLWLNEGFTTYFTNRIVEAVYGKEQAQLELMIEFGRLQEAMDMTPRENQTLPANLQQGDPNDAFNRFTYDKASLFVHFLETRLGREAFDAFLKAYIERFAFVAITTEDFIAYARHTLLVAHADKLTEAELLEWIYGEGLPQGVIAPHSTSLDKVQQALVAWRGGAALSVEQTRDWLVPHWQFFLASLAEPISEARLAELDDVFHLGRSGNAEIACDWLRLAIRNHYQPALNELETFLCRIGRGKFVRPLYQALHQAGYEAELKAIYAKARAGYHPSLRVQLDRLLPMAEA